MLRSDASSNRTQEVLETLAPDVRCCVPLKRCGVARNGDKFVNAHCQVKVTKVLVRIVVKSDNWVGFTCATYAP